MNLELYNAVRSVPAEAKKEIRGGRLNGKTDINPMWRIKKLTEQFGPCGFGWKYTIDREWLETGANGEISAFMDISLYYKYNGEWSEAVPGTGGSAFIAKEKAGLYTSDECYKMALTDALSVACKALGIAADVYWDKDRTKYDEAEKEPEPPTGATEKEPKPETDATKCEKCGKVLHTYKDAKGIPVSIMKHVNGSLDKFGHVYCIDCIKEINHGPDRGNPAEEQTA